MKIIKALKYIPFHIIGGCLIGWNLAELHKGISLMSFSCIVLGAFLAFLFFYLQYSNRYRNV